MFILNCWTVDVDTLACKIITEQIHTNTKRTSVYIKLSFQYILLFVYFHLDLSCLLQF